MHGHCGDCIPKHANEHANLFCIFIVIILIFYLKGCTLGLCPVLFPNSQCQHRTQQVENTQVNAFPTLFLSQTVNWPCLNLNKGTGELLSILLALRLHRDMYKVIFFFFFFVAVPVACGNSHPGKRIYVTAATQVPAVTMLDPQPIVPQGNTPLIFLSLLFVCGGGY